MSKPGYYFIPLRARKSAPIVNLDVVTPVSLTNSAPTNPMVVKRLMRSPPGIAPPIQSDQFAAVGER